MIKIVVSAIIRNKENKVLAVKLAKEIVGGVWVPPGGKLEENETARECLIRELNEELDIEVELGEIVGITEEKYPDGEWVFILYDAEIIKGEPKCMEPGKILEVGYVEIEQIKKHELIKWVK
jgi:8-oxo-dGTP diphosphatase